MAQLDWILVSVLCLRQAESVTSVFISTGLQRRVLFKLTLPMLAEQISNANVSAQLL